MKFKLKYLAVALGVAASLPSFAAIVKPSGADPEIFLSVWNNDKSFTFDTGVALSSFTADAGVSQTWATLTSANTEFVNFIGAAPLTSFNYAVLGGSQFSLLSTVTVGKEDQVALIQNPEIPSAQNQINFFLGEVNATGTHKTLPNGQSVNLKGTLAYFQDRNTNNYNGAFAGGSGSLYTVSNVVGTSSQFTKIDYDVSGDDFTPGIVSIQPGTVLFGKTGDNYVLSYEVAAVPEPSANALTLLGLGMLGVIKLRRRRSTN